MSNENIIFRTSVNGYNKRDVYKYLEGVNKDIKDRSDEYKKKVSELESKNKELSDKSNILDAKLSELRSENQTLKKSLKEKESDILTLTDEKAKATLKAAVLESENKEKDALIEELDSAAVKISLELDSLAAQYSELVEKYEQAVFVTDDITELKKKADAYDKIVTRAKEKKQTAQQPVEKIEEKQDIDSILTVSAQEILEHIKEAQTKFSEAISNAQKESELLKERVNNVINSSKEKILSQIK